MASRKTTTTTHQAQATRFPKPKKRKAKAGERGSLKPIRIRNDMTVTDGQQRVSIVRLFCERWQASTAHDRRTKCPARDCR